MKTSELTGVALDWAVAKCMGHRVAENYGSYIRIYLPDPKQSGYTLAFCPSTDWALGGPIIEREDIAMSSKPDGLWAAYAPQGTKAVTHAGQTVEVYNWTYKQYGYTPLIAAMRCYVASKLGDEVEIPKELTT